MASSSSAVPLHPWEAPHYGEEGAGDPGPELERETAAHNMVEALKGLYLGGKMSAKSLCEICFWAAKAGVRGGAARGANRAWGSKAPGRRAGAPNKRPQHRQNTPRSDTTPPVETLALNPAAASGHFQRHLDKLLGFDEDVQGYDIKVPGHLRDEPLGRSKIVLPLRPPHELLED
eukprot:3892652-Alexandrium_andersonii.AAC.1